MNHCRRWDRIREKGQRGEQEGRELTKKFEISVLRKYGLMPKEIKEKTKFDYGYIRNVSHSLNDI